MKEGTNFRNIYVVNIETKTMEGKINFIPSIDTVMIINGKEQVVFDVAYRVDPVMEKKKVKKDEILKESLQEDAFVMVRNTRGNYSDIIDRLGI